MNGITHTTKAPEKGGAKKLYEFLRFYFGKKYKTNNG